MKNINYPKRLYPHIHELVRLGADETPEGRLYTAKYQNEIWREYSDYKDFRRLVGGDKGAHNMIKDEHT